jgi:type VI protein secretion system component Hcp
MTNVHVLAVNHTGVDDGHLVETVAFNFTKMKTWATNVGPQGPYGKPWGSNLNFDTEQGTQAPAEA